MQGLEFIIDGVERPIQRPKNPEWQRQFYSGKKKRHSIKNNLIIERRTRKIKGLSTTCEGKKHDKRLADEQALRFPKGQSSGRTPVFRAMNPQGSRPCKQRRNPRGANSAPKRRRPIGVSPSYGYASSTVAPESRSYVASVILKLFPYCILKLISVLFNNTRCGAWGICRLWNLSGRQIAQVLAGHCLSLGVPELMEGASVWGLGKADEKTK